MKNLFDLSGKVALVTGGNSGIGFGMAEGLAQHGAQVIIWGTNAEKNASAVEKISAQGCRVQSAVVDVTDEAAVKQAMAAIIAQYGRIDQAIANAGVSIPRASFFDIALDDFRQMNELNVLGVVSTLREAARHMVERHKAGDSGGSLVGISSTASIHGAARNEHYGATKGAVVSLCRAMAVELAPKGIRVNCVAPGWVRSEMTGKLQEWDKFNENVIGRVPFGGWADGADFAGIAVYLASKASRFHLGDTLVVDGGYTIY